MTKKQKTSPIVFGPVPSRRLGRSLGINNIPTKTCSYSCVYCQLGRTTHLNIGRNVFYLPSEIVDAVFSKVDHATLHHETIDYLTFVAEGEPTLDMHLGTTIQHLKEMFHIPIAVITNGSLLSHADIRHSLMQADYVSVKVDSITPKLWSHIDRPYGNLQLSTILEGIQHFSDEYSGTLVTETMLLSQLNTTPTELHHLASYLATLQPDLSYLSIPTRPPAEKTAIGATAEELTRAHQILTDSGLTVELLTGYEGNTFSFTGDVVGDLLAMCSVHPIRKDGIHSYLQKAGADWEVISQLLLEGRLKEIHYQGETFYLRDVCYSDSS